MTIKENIQAYCFEGLDPKAGVKNPDRKHNVGNRLFEILYWQEPSSLADTRLKQAWGAAIEDGLIKDDDYYRSKGPGDTIVAESPSFSVVMKVSKAREALESP